MKRIDMTGRVFERLKVKEFDRIENKRTYWKCECECGKIVSVDGNKLRSGRTKSCGCYNADRIKKQRKFNEYKIVDGYAEVKLSDENYMFCDIEDWEQFKGHYWFMNDTGYAVCETMATGILRFHKLVTGTTADVIIDHINRNKLDNRKHNLRIATKEVNAINRGLQSNNTTGHAGVHFNNKSGTWNARVKVHGKVIWLGAYPTKEEAIAARLAGEEKYYKPQLESVSTGFSL
ncbi:hypothetical protein D3Z36_15990 [Lachnospiraceae bacterium]|nr:hypothetical protein [Lachnospiraceae bacterium]